MFVGSAPLRALASLALPQACAVCRTPDVGLCADCRAEVRAALWCGGARRCRPDPEPQGLPPVHAAGRFEGALAGLVTAYKDEDRRDLAPVLSSLLATAVDAALAEGPAHRALAAGDGPVLLVPVPSSRASRRRRGDAPLVSLASASARGFARREIVVADVLRIRRRVADQAGLGAVGRQRNVEHAMAVRGAWVGALSGVTCVLVDDVVTTGATLREGARALSSGGAATVVAAAICATRRRSATPSRFPASSR